MDILRHFMERGELERHGDRFRAPGMLAVTLLQAEGEGTSESWFYGTHARKEAVLTYLIFRERNHARVFESAQQFLALGNTGKRPQIPGLKVAVTNDNWNQVRGHKCSLALHCIITND